MSLQDYDFGVNLSDIQDIDGFSPIPPGEYQVQGEQVSLKNTKTGGGKYLLFELNVIEGPYKNRKIFQNVIVEHSNEDAKRIGLQWLKSWILACNGTGDERLTLSLILRFLNQPCLAFVSIEEGRSGYSDQNKIQRFKKLKQELDDMDMPF